MISDEEFLLLYDENSSKNTELEPSFNVRTRVLKSVTATQEHLDMRSGCHGAKLLPVGVVVPRTSDA